jgi:dual specificity MAP kinase phosphatase
MSSAAAPSTEDNVVYGLNYPPDFLPSLPVLLSRPSPHTPIRALTAAQFAAIHQAATTSHAPDHVLFPFLHGLEGDNEQQNAFFSVTSDTPVIPPRFRGLIWVACEDDDMSVSDDAGDEDIIASDDSDDEAGSDGGDMGHSFGLDMDMDIDTDLDLDHSHKQEAPSSAPSTALSPGALDSSCDASDPENEPHMHPVKCRAPRIYTNTNVSRDRSTSSSSSSASSFQSLSMSMPSPPTPATSFDSPPPSCLPLGPLSPEPQPRTVPLLTSGFKPRDLLQLNAEGYTEFVPLRVPDGISLRNFDIQLVRVLWSFRSPTFIRFRPLEKGPLHLLSIWAPGCFTPDGQVTTAGKQLFHVYSWI